MTTSPTHGSIRDGKRLLTLPLKVSLLFIVAYVVRPGGGKTGKPNKRAGETYGWENASYVHGDFNMSTQRDKVTSNCRAEFFGFVFE